MAYQINKTDGTIVATVADGQIDTLSTDLTLIGKNYSGFGESLNENFIKLLENFSNVTAPEHPIRGQIWFDTSENKLKVYNGLDFIPVSSATISSTQPDTLSIGDLWWNETAEQLYFYDGTEPVLLGPAFSSTQGLSGLKVESILDTLNQTRVITYLYNNGILLGIFAKDNFTPKNEIIGFTGSIQPGFNAGTLSGLKFNVTCTNSEQLGGVPATTYVRTDTSNIINGQVRITTDLGLVIGSAGQSNLYVTSGDIYFSNAASNRNLILNVRRGITQENALVVDAANRQVKIYESFSDCQVIMGGDLTINGNLTVEGTTTTVNTSNLTIEDKNIIIANVTSPTDTTADGAGITIRSDTPGTGDKTIIYSQSNNWLDVSETLNLESGKALYIGGTKVIDGNSLGFAITSIPGVSSFGKQNVVNIGPGTTLDPTLLRLTTVETSPGVFTPRISTLSSNLDLQLAPDGTGNVALVGSPKITGLADPTSNQDAATKNYVDNIVETRDIVFSMDLSDGKSNTYIINNVLNGPDALRPGLAEDPTTAIARGRTPKYREGTKAKILCTLLSNATTSLDINSLPPAISTGTFITNHLTGASALAMTNISFPTASIPGSSLSTVRIIKTFTITAGIWSHTSDVTLDP